MIKVHKRNIAVSVFIHLCPHLSLSLFFALLLSLSLSVNTVGCWFENVFLGVNCCFHKVYVGVVDTSHLIDKISSITRFLFFFVLCCEAEGQRLVQRHNKTADFKWGKTLLADKEG